MRREVFFSSVSQDSCDNVKRGSLLRDMVSQKKTEFVDDPVVGGLCCRLEFVDLRFAGSRKQRDGRGTGPSCLFFKTEGSRQQVILRETMCLSTKMS